MNFRLKPLQVSEHIVAFIAKEYSALNTAEESPEPEEGGPEECVPNWEQPADDG